MSPYSHSDRKYNRGEIKAKSLIRTESEADFHSHLDSKSNSSNPSPDSEQQADRDFP